MLCATLATRWPPFLLALVCLTAPLAAQSPAVQHSGAVKGLDPQPDPPGKFEVPISQLAKYRPDIAFPPGNGGVSIGRKHAEWGDKNRLALEAKAAQGADGSRCVFDLAYNMSNLNPVPTGEFMNVLVPLRLNSGGSRVPTAETSVIQSPLSLQPSETRTVHATVSLEPGTSAIEVAGDASHQVSEVNEQNNRGVIYVIMTGDCGKASIPTLPADEKAHVRFLPPGTPNTFDQTDAKPAPGHSAPGIHNPGAVKAIDTTDCGPAPASQIQQGPESKEGAGGFVMYGAQQALLKRLGRAGCAIRVGFANGVVTLTGQVPTPQSRRDAESALKTVPGVSKIEDRLTVEPSR